LGSRKSMPSETRALRMSRRRIVQASFVAFISSILTDLGSRSQRRVAASG
jgi:hypothetical protein